MDRSSPASGALRSRGRPAWPHLTAKCPELSTTNSLEMSKHCNITNIDMNLYKLHKMLVMLQTRATTCNLLSLDLLFCPSQEVCAPSAESAPPIVPAGGRDEGRAGEASEASEAHGVLPGFDPLDLLQGAPRPESFGTGKDLSGNHFQIF